LLSQEKAGRARFDVLSNPKSARQRERRHEQAMIKKLLSGTITSEVYDELLNTILTTRTGKARFPKMAKAVAIPKEASKVVANLAHLYGVMTSGRNSHAAGDLVVMLGNGVSYKFLEEEIGVPAARARAYKAAAKKKGVLPDLLTLRYVKGDPLVYRFSVCVCVGGWMCHSLSRCLAVLPLSPLFPLFFLSLSSLCPLRLLFLLPNPPRYSQTPSASHNS
jgi:hypothetical protein